MDEHTAFSMDGPLEGELGFDIAAFLVLAGALALGALFVFVTGVGFRRGGRSSIGMTFVRVLWVSIPADVSCEGPEKSGSCRGGGNGEVLYVKLGMVTGGCIGYGG